MRRKRSLFRWLSAWLLVSMLGVGLLGGAGLAVRAAPRQQIATGMVISEFRTRGTALENDEFIELYNPTSSAINISNWQIQISDNTGNISQLVNIPSSTSAIGSGRYYLISNSVAYSGSATPNLTYTMDIPDDGGIALIDTYKPICPYRSGWNEFRVSL